MIDIYVTCLPQKVFAKVLLALCAVRSLADLIDVTYRKSRTNPIRIINLWFLLRSEIRFMFLQMEYACRWGADSRKGKRYFGF